MARITVYNLARKKTGEMDLDDSVFSAPVKKHLMHETVRMQLNRRRSGTAAAKERNAVAGGGRKPYRQKGTGRARQGSVTAPNHVGGGVVFGPRPRSYDFRPPAKARRGALVSALSMLFADERITVVEDFSLPEIKTKELAGILQKLKVSRAVVVDDRNNENLKKSIRNMRDHKYLSPEGVNVYDLLRHDGLVITRGAAHSLQERLSGRD